VLVHVHDIYLPWEYDEEFTRRGYSEQYMLAAFLLSAADWEVQLPVKYLRHRGILRYGGCPFGCAARVETAGKGKVVALIQGGDCPPSEPRARSVTGCRCGRM
jgi:hypothetical protein